MKRFEIEEMVAQDTHGVVFRAHDTSSEAPVAIRRFFPFGRDGDGLAEDEGIAFSIAASRLATLDHPALRRVIEGSVDPIDGMPYLVSEWIEGVTLPHALAGENLDPSHIIDVMRLALEVSLVLSDVLGEEALWVETDPHSILIGDAGSGRGFTFWISPFKWLGAESRLRNLSDLVTLGESLAGWTNKVVSDQAGNGLGGWLKWLKANPDTTLHQALRTLPSSTATGEKTPPPSSPLPNTPPTSPKIKLKQPSTKTPLLILAALSLLVLGVALSYFHKTAQAPVIEDPFTKSEISDIITEPTETPQADPPRETEEIATTQNKFEENTPVAETKPAKIPAQATTQTAPEKTQTSPTDLSPEDRATIQKLDTGVDATLTGILRRTRFSSTGKSLYLEFESDAPDSVRGVIHQRGYPDDYSREAFEELTGKTITLQGSVFKDNFGNPALLKINSRQAISETP